MIRYVKSRPRLTRDMKVSWRYDIYNRMVSPWACLVITLFAIPAGVATGRQSVFVGVVSAIGMFFSFYALTLICGGLAKKDLIPVGVGVLAPNLLFLAAGLILYYRQR
jgi:lipopolysaccharide export LptBFGC system permease protein LptF